MKTPHPVRRPSQSTPPPTTERRRTAEPPPRKPWDGPVDEWVDDMDGEWDAVLP
ncbi:MAG: hypothetical protein ACRDT6_06370 [Micromonosporaceae bacterium]